MPRLGIEKQNDTIDFDIYIRLKTHPILTYFFNKNRHIFEYEIVSLNGFDDDLKRSNPNSILLPVFQIGTGLS
jgi:hypothetical protein